MSEPEWKIVLIDDEPGIRKVTSITLEDWGYVVDTAENGKAGIELCNRILPQMVITDVKMPGMDGLETLTEIKKGHPLKEVIMLTGHATIETAIDGMKLGAFDYLMKPCDMDVLMAKVEEAAAKKQKHKDKIEKARIEEIMSTRSIS